MKIDAINFGAFTATTPLPTHKAEESGTTNTDEFDDTRVATKQQRVEQSVSSPIERQNGTIEDLMSMQVSTERMAHSFGFSNLEQASNSTSENSGAISAISSSTNLAFKA